MKIKKIITACFTISVFIACGAGENPADGEKTQKSVKKTFSYSFSYNGCETGKHTFKSEGAYCKGLLDEALNRYCAAKMRRDRYKSECGK